MHDPRERGSRASFAYPSRSSGGSASDEQLRRGAYRRTQLSKMARMLRLQALASYDRLSRCLDSCALAHRSRIVTPVASCKVLRLASFDCGTVIETVPIEKDYSTSVTLCAVRQLGR